MIHGEEWTCPSCSWSKRPEPEISPRSSPSCHQPPHRELNKVKTWVLELRTCVLELRVVNLPNWCRFLFCSLRQSCVALNFSDASGILYWLKTILSVVLMIRETASTALSTFFSRSQPLLGADKTTTELGTGTEGFSALGSSIAIGSLDKSAADSTLAMAFKYPKGLSGANARAESIAECRCHILPLF